MKQEELSLENIQNESFQILLKIKDVFEKNGWKFYLAFGTLLGSIRHKGFIPWDDDVDIFVKRKDYESFINFCISNPKELFPLELINYRTNSRYPYVISRISNSEFIAKYKFSNDYGLGTFIDVYPVDSINACDFGKFREKQFLLIKRLTRAYTYSNRKIVNFFRYVYRPICLLSCGVLSKRKLIKKIDINAQKYSNDKCDSLSVLAWCEIKDGIYDKSFFGDGIFSEFNGVFMPVPSGFDYILKNKYGDYMTMPPENERISHHYYTIYKK